MNKEQKYVDKQAVLSTQRKRPTQQLYVPPAQRNRKMLIRKPDEKSSVTNGKSGSKSFSDPSDSLVKTDVISSSCSTRDIFSQMNDLQVSRSDSSKKDGDETHKKHLDEETDKEKEEMRRATEGINHKSRSIIKYVDPTDALDIGFGTKVKTVVGSLSSWEDLLGDTGELKEQYLTEETRNPETDPQKASQCFAHRSKSLEDLEHVIELYKFPSSFKTHDIVQIYSDIQVDSMYIKWVNETHALLVLSTPALAQRALQVESDLIKSRPMSEASCLSRSVALKNDLKPVMKRPQTVLQTARRMITTHLGTKTRLSKEILDQERKILQDAREQRRMERQNEKDAWEGNPKSSCC